MALSLPQDRLLAIIAVQSEIAATALDLDRVMELVVARAREIVGADGAAIELVEGEEMVYTAVSGAAEAYASIRLKVETSLSGLSLRLGEVLRCDDAEQDDRVDLDACRRVGATSMVCLPLTHGERVVGVLKVFSGRRNAFDQADVETLDLLSSLIASSMAHADDFAAHQHESRHDTLTGLPNRRAFDERIATEIARVARYGGRLALALADLDGFKYINDTYRHPVGDGVLCAVAGHLRSIRGGDAAFRFGGDEFAVIFTGNGGADGARKAMYRVEDAVGEDPACCEVGISWGVAHMQQPVKRELLALADRALYQAKAARAALPAISSPQLR